MIRAIIFDLDMCILDTRSLSGSFFEPVLQPLRNANLPTERKKEIEEALWALSLEDAVTHFSIPRETAEEMRDAYRCIEPPENIKSFGDELCIRELSVSKILVTSGYRHFQTVKIARLGIENLFDEIIIDALDVRETRKGKKKIFEEILERYNLEKKEVLVVGDNPLSELGVAKELGIVSVQTTRPSVEKWNEADYQIQTLCELSDIMMRLR